MSSVAFGTYLGECDEETDARYADTLREAIATGVNLIDTAINYRCQRSERVIGSVLAGLIANGSVSREALVVCTKAGYIPLDSRPPASREEYQELLQREYLRPGILTAADIVGGGHSLAPRFIEDQLQRSLKNLGLAAVDYFYLHNPEQQLAAGVAAADFEARIRTAFELLESHVQAGRIGAYGCATWNGFRLPAESQGHLSLFRLEALAREVAGDGHHFRIAQLPINLSMSEAVRVSTQRDRRGRLIHLVDAAQDLGIDLVASAPLMQGQLAKDLPGEIREALPGETDAQRALAFARGVRGVVAVAVGMRSPEHLRENIPTAHN